MADPFIRDPDGREVAGDADVASSDASQFMHKDVHDAGSQAGAWPPEKMDDMLSPDTASVGDFSAPAVDMKAGDTSLVGKMELGTPSTAGGQDTVSTQEFNTPAESFDYKDSAPNWSANDQAGAAQASPGSGAGFTGDRPGAPGGSEGLEPLYGRGESAGGADYPMPKMDGARVDLAGKDSAGLDDEDGPSTLLGSEGGTLDVGIQGPFAAHPLDMPEVELDPDESAGA